MHTKIFPPQHARSADWHTSLTSPILHVSPFKLQKLPHWILMTWWYLYPLIVCICNPLHMTKTEPGWIYMLRSCCLQLAIVMCANTAKSHNMTIMYRNDLLRLNQLFSLITTVVWKIFVENYFDEKYSLYKKFVLRIFRGWCLPTKIF